MYHAVCRLVSFPFDSVTVLFVLGIICSILNALMLVNGSISWYGLDIYIYYIIKIYTSSSSNSMSFALLISVFCRGSYFVVIIEGGSKRSGSIVSLYNVEILLLLSIIVSVSFSCFLVFWCLVFVLPFFSLHIQYIWNIPLTSDNYCFLFFNSFQIQLGGYSPFCSLCSTN